MPERVVHRSPQRRRRRRGSMAPSVHRRIAASLVLVLCALRSLPNNNKGPGRPGWVFVASAQEQQPRPPLLPSPTVTNPGESCRLRLVNEWLDAIGEERNEDSPRDFGVETVAFIGDDTEPMPDAGRGDALLFSSSRAPEPDADLLAAMARVQETSLYRSILEDCSFFLGAFHEAAEETCIRERDQEPFNVTFPYSRFWDVGPINLDGGLLLAADLLRSGNLEDPGPLVPCADACYVRTVGGGSGMGDDDDDCQETNHGGGGGNNYYYNEPGLGNALGDLTVIREAGTDSESFFDGDDTLCHLRWLETDAAYQELRLCAAESHVGRTTIAARSGNANGNNANGSIETDEAVAKASAVARAYRIQAEHQAECLAARVCAEPDMEIMDTIFGSDNADKHDHSGNSRYGPHSGGTGLAAAAVPLVPATLAAVAAVVVLLP